MRHTTTARGGFSLLEILMVVLILGIVAMAIIPGVNGALDDARLNAAAGAVVDALQFARLSAMASGQSTKVTIDASNGKVQVQGLKIDKLTDVQDPTKTELSERDVEEERWRLMDSPFQRGQKYDIKVKGGAIYGDARFTSSSFGSGGDTVQFDAYGVPSSSGLVAVVLGVATAKVSLAAGSGAVSVTK